MFDFDVITGPGNATRPAKPDTPREAATLNSPAVAPAAARDGGREAERPPSEPAAARP
jgi:hypothetical protein